MYCQGCKTLKYENRKASKVAYLLSVPLSLARKLKLKTKQRTKKLKCNFNKSPFLVIPLKRHESEYNSVENRAKYKFCTKRNCLATSIPLTTAHYWSKYKIRASLAVHRKRFKFTFNSLRSRIHLNLHTDITAFPPSSHQTEMDFTAKIKL